VPKSKTGTVYIAIDFMHMVAHFTGTHIEIALGAGSAHQLYDRCANSKEARLLVVNMLLWLYVDKRN
jgi:hypothetical protein